MTSSSFFKSAALAALVSAPALQAHIGWSGSRNFDTLAIGVTETSADRTVSSAFGWADGADANWGDSHRLTYFRFVVSGFDSVTITAARNDLGGQTGAAGVFLPSFSLFRIGTGTMPASTHDSATASVAYLTGLFGTDDVAESFTDTNTNSTWNVGEDFIDANGNGVWDSAGLGNSGKEGSFNALGDWQIFSDSGAQGDFRYVSHVANAGSESLITGTFTGLAAGEYFIAVGGSNYLAQNTQQATFPTYGVAVSVTAIPEPSAFAAVAGLGVLGLAALRRRRA